MADGVNTGILQKARQSRAIGLSLWAGALAVLGAGAFGLGVSAVLDVASPDFIPFPADLAAFLALFGTLNLAQGLLGIVRFGKQGDSRLEAGPAVAGKIYRGKIRTERPLEVTGPFSLRLLCESQAVSNGDDSRVSSKSRAPVWEARASAPASTQASLGIPFELDRKSTRLNSSHIPLSRMPSSA